MPDIDRRLERLEQQVSDLRSRNRWWQTAAISAFVVAGLTLATPSQSAKKALVLSDGVTTLTLAPDGIVFNREGKDLARYRETGFTIYNEDNPRVSLETSDTWTGMVIHSRDGTPTLVSGTDQENGTSIKIFSAVNRQLRLEMADRLLDAGSGVRVYDSKGLPRATLYTERRGETGLELTDANRQPRVDIYAQEGGGSVLRAMDGKASSIAELTVMPETDARVRVTGVMPSEIPAKESFVPMLYLLDRSGTHEISMPVELE